METILLKLLSSVILFRGLDRDDLTDLLRGASKNSFAKGDVVFEEGFEGHSMYVVLSGRFEVIKQVQGEEAHLAYVEPGEHFGEMALLTDRYRTATVLAAEPSVALRLPRKVVFSRPHVASLLMKNMAVLLVEHLSEMNNEVLLLDVSRRKRGQGKTAFKAEESFKGKLSDLINGDIVKDENE